MKYQCLENVFSKKLVFQCFSTPKHKLNLYVTLFSCLVAFSLPFFYFIFFLNSAKAIATPWARCEGHDMHVGILPRPWQPYRHATNAMACPGGGACCCQGQITSLSSSCFFPPFFLFHFFLNSFSLPIKNLHQTSPPESHVG